MNKDIMNKDRFVFLCEIYDNETKTNLISSSFNSSHLELIIVELDLIMARLLSLKGNQ